MIGASYYWTLDKASAVKDWFLWHAKEKREQRRSTTLAYEEEHMGIVGKTVVVLSVLLGVAAAFGGFYLAVVGVA